MLQNIWLETQTTYIL